MQNHVLRIRRAAGDGLVDTVNGAYVFGPSVELDTEVLTDAISEAVAAQRRHDHGTRRAVLESALAGLDGEPFADLVEGPQVAAARRHIREVHAGAEEGLAEALLAQGAIREAIELLARLTAENRYRERRWWLLMLGQYRAGRRRDALATYNEAREQLVNGAGIEPGDELSRLERLIGADDPMLMTPAVLATPVQSGVADARRSEQFVGREVELAPSGRCSNAF
ncbi:MAG: hypothetical protein M5U31_09730 [Acidimicrobiia bacterium]|nr:hypothetical protein [Acidimicrobiia bacterium]